MIIDYGRIAAAEAYYQAAGFTLVAAPWIVGQTAYYATKPLGTLDYVTLGGYLAASAEQSFLQLILKSAPPGRAVATTPCFRHEAQYDDLHQPYFMKVELIDTLDTSAANLQRMIIAAQSFFEQYIATRIVQTSPDSWDIETAGSGIELGSYGRRYFQGRRWLYGTGLAEPRLSQALARSTEES